MIARVGPPIRENRPHLKRLTNREIAERLILSPKTVERHLGRIYRTLGISSRVELAREVERSARSD